MKIFDKEIQSELIMMEQQTYTAQENEINMRFQTSQQTLRNEIAALKNEIELKTVKRDELDRIAQEEADGPLQFCQAGLLGERVEQLARADEQLDLPVQFGQMLLRGEIQGNEIAVDVVDDFHLAARLGEREREPAAEHFAGTNVRGNQGEQPLQHARLATRPAENWFGFQMGTPLLRVRLPRCGTTV